MKNYILFTTLFLLVSFESYAQGDLQWLMHINNVDQDCDVHSMTVDASSNIYIGGSVNEQVTCGTCSGASQVSFDAVPVVPLGTRQDGYIAKYNSAKVQQWMIQFGTGQPTTGFSPLGMAERGGFLYVVGSFEFGAVPGVDFDPGAGTNNVISAGGGTNFFVAKFNSSTGALVWVYTGAGSGSSNLARDIVIDNAGNLYVYGDVKNGFVATGFIANFDIKSGTTVNTLGITNSNHLFLAKYDANGNFLWRNNMSNTNNKSGGGLAYDAVNDMIYITGGVEKNSGINPGFASVGGGSTSLNVNATARDVFVAKYNPAGVLQWVKNMVSGTSDNYTEGIDVDGSGNIYISGKFAGTADFNPSGTSNRTVVGSSDAFVAKYDALGAYTWAYRLGSTAYDIIYNVDVTSTNKLLVAGAIRGAVDVNPEGTGGAQNKGGANTIYFGEYDTDFKYQWAHTVGTSTDFNNSAFNVLVDENDVTSPLYLFGYMGKTTTQDFDPNNAGGSYASTGSRTNSFFAKYSTAVVLPIELLSFDAKLNNSVVDLTWVTSTEINNDYFTIQKSKDAINFVDVLTQSGAGNSNIVLNYEDVDNNPFNGISYYRLKQTDFDGAFSYSGIRTINLNDKKGVNIIHANNEIRVIDDSNRNLDVTIVNSLGQIIMNAKSINGSEINLTNLSKGVYFVRVYNDRSLIGAQKILKF